MEPQVPSDVGAYPLNPAEPDGAPHSGGSHPHSEDVHVGDSPPPNYEDDEDEGQDDADEGTDEGTDEGQDEPDQEPDTGDVGDSPDESDSSTPEPILDETTEEPTSLATETPTAATAGADTEEEEEEEREDPHVEVNHDAYDLISQVFVAEIQASMFVYKHTKTGADVLTLVPLDTTQDKTFGLSVKTPAENDKGTANVLLNCLLDGSEKYPEVYEPLEVLRRSSLATYLEADVHQDRSVYSGASRHPEDFQNIMQVYLDAVFNPIIIQEADTDWIFDQEAWRVEAWLLESDNTTQFRINGDTLNQQKGRYSDSQHVMETYVHQNLFKKSSYKYDNQGKPEGILALEIKDIRAYYAKYYHPTNMQVFLFGDTDDVIGGMNQFDTYASEYEMLGGIPSEVEFETIETVPWTEYKVPTTSKPFPVSRDEEDGDNMAILSWVVNHEEMDQKTEMAWRILDVMLLQSDTSRIRKKLENSGWGKDMISTGLRTDTKQWTFSVGLKGVKEGLVHNAEQKVGDVFITANTHGFHDDEMRSAFNTVEFQMRDYATGTHPRGVLLMNRILSKWRYGYAPESAFGYLKGLQQLVNEMQMNGSDFLVEQMNNGLRNSQHKAIVELYPEPEFDGYMSESDQERIDNLKDNMSEDEWIDFLTVAYNVKAENEKEVSEEALAAVPQLDPGQLSVETAKNALQFSVEEDILVTTTEVKSSFDIIHVDFGLDLSWVSFDDLFLLPLLKRLLLESGTATYSQSELDLQMGRVTGGMYFDILHEDVVPKMDGTVDPFTVFDGSHFFTKIFLRGKTIQTHLPDYFELVNEIVFNMTDTFDKKRVNIILDELIEELEEKIVHNGAEYANRRLQSRFSLHGLVSERLDGIDSLNALNVLLGELRGNWEDLNQRLQTLVRTISGGHRNGMVLNLVGEKEELANAVPHATTFLKDMVPRNAAATPFPKPHEGAHPWVPAIRDVLESRTSKAVDEGFIIPTEVSYVGFAGQLVEDFSPSKGSMAVVAKWIQDDYLYKKLVVEGGTGDAQCTYDYRHGVLTMISLQDPRISSTLASYEKLPNAVGQDILTTDKLPPTAREAIISTIADYDGSAPQPDEIGYTNLREYLRSESTDYKAGWRDEILNTEREDFVYFMDLLKVIKDASVVALGSKKEFEELEQDDDSYELTMTELTIDSTR